MEKVLIIDDDNGSRRIVKHILEQLGCAVIESGNGRHAWETLTENKDIKLIVTDILMPSMDGRELIHLVRGEESGKKLPIIILSGCFNQEELQPLMQDFPEVTYFLEKPLNKEALEAKVKELIERPATK